MAVRAEIYKNTISIGFCQLLSIALSMFVPYLFISNYGSSLNGLLATLSQIFAYIGIIEFGLGAATQMSLLPYLAKDDKDGISNILYISKAYYQKISIYYTIIYSSLAFILPFIIKTEVNYWTIFFIVIIEGASGTINFLFLTFWKMLLITDGKSHIIEKVNLIYKLFATVLKLILAYYSVNIIAIEVIYLFITVFTILIYRCYIKRFYSWIDIKNKVNPINKLNGRLSYAINAIAGTVLNSTDLVLLSIIFNTAYSSVYAVYNMIYLALNQLLTSVYFGISYILGKAYHKDINLYIKLHYAFETVFIMAISALMSCCSVLMIPFVKIYTQGITDIDYIYKYFPLLFGLTHILTWDRYVSGYLLYVAGKANVEARYSIVEASINIFLSILLSITIGIYGLLIGTVIALSYKVVKMTYYANSIILNKSSFNSYKTIIINLAIYLLIEIFCHLCPLKIISLIEFFKVATVTFILVTLIYFLINLMFNYEIFKSILTLKKIQLT